MEDQKISVSVCVDIKKCKLAYSLWTELRKDDIPYNIGEVNIVEISCNWFKVSETHFSDFFETRTRQNEFTIPIPDIVAWATITEECFTMEKLQVKVDAQESIMRSFRRVLES